MRAYTDDATVIDRLIRRLSIKKTISITRLSSCWCIEIEDEDEYEALAYECITDFSVHTDEDFFNN
jgi:hypothetical protein